MKISYNYNDIYLSKVFFWNMDYLTKKGNYDILRIELINKKIFNANVHRISDDKYIINIEKYKIRFEQISSMILIQNNDTIFPSKKIIDL